MGSIPLGFCPLKVVLFHSGMTWDETRVKRVVPFVVRFEGYKEGLQSQIALLCNLVTVLK